MASFVPPMSQSWGDLHQICVGDRPVIDSFRAPFRFIDMLLLFETSLVVKNHRGKTEDLTTIIRHSN